MLQVFHGLHQRYCQDLGVYRAPELMASQKHTREKSETDRERERDAHTHPHVANCKLSMPSGAGVEVQGSCTQVLHSVYQYLPWVSSTMSWALRSLHADLRCAQGGADTRMRGHAPRRDGAPTSIHPCCFVLLVPTPLVYRVPRVSPGVTAPKPFPPTVT